jgi:vancomycin aglycone glucosyltransferase
VQPVIALALELRERGQDVRLCLPQNFIEWAQSLGFVATPVGIEMRAPRKGAANSAAAPAPLPDLITDQFDSVGAAARGCDIILGANAHQYAARSIAEVHGIPYINALYAPTALPGDDNTRAWNDRSLQRVNANRRRLGLSPIDDVLRHIVTEHPLLATDPTLTTQPSVAGMVIVQTGAWFWKIRIRCPLRLRISSRSGAARLLWFGSMPVAGETAVPSLRPRVRAADAPSFRRMG